MPIQMPWLDLADGRRVQAVVGDNDQPDWPATTALYGPTAAVTSPAPTRVVPRDEFVRRIGLAHLAQIIAAATADPAIGALVLRVQTAGETIDLDAPDTVNGLGLLVTRGILTTAEAAEIRA